MQIDPAEVTTRATSFAERIYLGNSIRQWLVAGAVFLIALAVLLAVRWLLVRQISRTSDRTRTKLDDYFLSLLRHTRYSFLVLMALAPALKMIVLPGQAAALVNPLLRLVLILQIGLWLGELATLYIRDLATERSVSDVASVTTIRAMGLVVKLLLWTAVALLALRNFGVDVTALLTTLGIAGIAAALAVQNILGDILASLSIVLDKPFVVGDFIAVDEFSGTVEEIGIKTTRVRSISGEKIIFSNSDLLTSRILNYKSMTQRRVVFTFGVEYGTPADVVERITVMVREVIEGLEKTRFDRAHFAKYGDWSLKFEVVYYVTEPDYALYMDLQQRMNLEIYERVEAMGARFAQPTRVLIDRELRGRGSSGSEPGPATGPGPKLTGAPA